MFGLTVPLDQCEFLDLGECIVIIPSYKKYALKCSEVMGHHVPNYSQMVPKNELWVKKILDLLYLLSVTFKCWKLKLKLISK